MPLIAGEVDLVGDDLSLGAITFPVGVIDSHAPVWYGIEVSCRIHKLLRRISPDSTAPEAKVFAGTDLSYTSLVPFGAGQLLLGLDFVSPLFEV